MTTDTDTLSRPETQIPDAPSPWKVFARVASTIWSNGKARIGLVVLALFILIAVFAPLIAPYGASENGFDRSADTSPGHWLGTTAAGEDVLSQLVWGSQISIFVGLTAGLLSTIIAVLVGLSWGYVRGFGADVINFVVNLFLVIPGLPLMIVIAAYLSGGGIGMIIVVVVITGWAWGARVLRSQTQSLRSRDFVTAAVFSGERPFRIVFREILPNMTSLIVGHSGDPRRGRSRIPRARRLQHRQLGHHALLGAELERPAHRPMGAAVRPRPVHRAAGDLPHPHQLRRGRHQQPAPSRRK
jgi:peptide/nickel transport system permease protein